MFSSNEREGNERWRELIHWVIELFALYAQLSERTGKVVNWLVEFAASFK